mmetsp:Transcript_12240/g.25084  ORF Transcript_12240/g.25084 Transcript_12240/m.25084 type:complete len:291 (-) Transcript_12240:128-1000(-)|eukprot:CAMPEP_0118646410 /NCGR_PEP_ID=MMETSP0785-20121206/8039_1 /TAXON_ID=91992 /ORGANISM="Bolidomonas pacifica, Strain CCMP 1866" /LENGTH=290 /DNA_ID=CAMNT_0006538397 /DNA_START=30 /DNA_END=902 /DNA_ORIENTATION=-
MDAILAPLEPLLVQFDAVGTFVLDYVDPSSSLRAWSDGFILSEFRDAAFVACAYVAFVVFGSLIFKLPFVPKIDPYPLKFLYNMSQMMLCAYMTVEAGLVAYRNNYTIFPPNAYSTSSPPLGPVLYIFYLSKVWDFWDTIFIVIGKKWKQLSFLHVYHHTTIFLFYWLNARVNYDGDIYLTIVLNGLIHTIMYTYYFVSMHTKIPSKYAKDGKSGTSVPIWWKPILTMQQMVQFVCMMSQACYLIYNDIQTPPMIITQVYLVYIFTLLILFAQFFVKSYTKPKGKKGKRD